MFGNYGLTPFLHIVIAWNLVFSLNWSWHFISNAFPLKIINYGQGCVSQNNDLCLALAPKTKVLN